MVVSRKQPVAPAPPISRSSSSQPLPTKRQTKISTTSNATQPNPRTVNGHGTNSQKSASTQTSTKKKSPQKRKAKSFIDRLFFFGLSAFTLYAFYICRPNPLFSSSSSYSPEPTLCRSLSTYKTHILDPYVVPPLKHTLSFTQRISEPYIAEAKSQLSPYIEPIQTALDTVSPYVKSSAKSAKKVWHGTLVPLYTNTLKPYYDTAVIPRYTRYIKPRLVPIQAKAERYFAHYVSNPIRSKTNLLLLTLHKLYHQYIDQYVRLAKPHVRRASNTVTDSAEAASEVYTTHVHPRALDAWVKAQPILSEAWNHFQVLVIRLIDVTTVLLKKATKEAGIYRREYVDPHVLRIWEKVADPKADGKAKGTLTPTTTATTIPLANDLPDTPSDETTPSEAIPESTPSTASTTTEAIPVTSEIPASPAVAETRVPTPEENVAEAPTVVVPETEKATHIPIMPKVEAFDTPTGAQDIPEPSADSASTATTPAHTASPSGTVAAIDETPVPESLESDAQESTPVDPVVEPAPSSTPEVEDLDEFLKELGVDEPQPQEEGDYTDPPPPELSEEEQKALRLAETAKKRADIEGRHDKWFEKIHAKFDEKKLELVPILQKIRDDAAVEVKSLSAAASMEKKDPRSLPALQRDGERFIKGLESYLKKAEGRSVDWKAQKDAPKDDDLSRIKEHIIQREKDKFGDVLTKVETKFSESITSLQQQVHQWYLGVKEEEASEVLGVGSEVRAVAARAQEDLSMDYAWLDDVTYLDWQRYHDLMRLYEKFDELSRQIANGTSTDPVPPSDPLIPALNELDRELQDIILGFNIALSGVRSQALKIFSPRPSKAEGEDDEDDEGFFVVNDGQTRRDDLRGVDLGKIEVKEAVGVIPVKEESTPEKEPETIGILPVPDVEKPASDDSSFDASKVVIGKDKVQIEQALKDVPLEAATRHEEL